MPAEFLVGSVLIWKRVDDASVMGSAPSVVQKRRESWGISFGGLFEFMLLVSVCVFVACVCRVWRIEWIYEYMGWGCVGCAVKR